MKDNQNKHILSLLFFTATLLCIFSCTKEKWQGRIYEEDGVTVVENKGSGLWDEKFAQDDITFRENLSIGAEAGEEYQMFDTNPQLAVDADLNIYILDYRNYRVLKFDKKGNFIWKAGRKGQGPGEFQYPSGLSWSPSDEICVLDNYSFLHFINGQGKYQHTVKLEGLYKRVHFLPDGRLLIERSLIGQPRVSAALYSKEGEFLKEFSKDYYYGEKNTAWEHFGSVYSGGGFRCFGRNVYLSLPDRYEIREFDLDGKLLRKIERNIRIKPPEIKASARSITVSVKDRNGPCFICKDNFIINQIRLVKEEDEKDRERIRLLDFFNTKGQFLGSYRLPESMELHTIDSEGNLYFIQNDPFPRIIRSTVDLD